MEARNRCCEKRRAENTQLRVRRYTGCIWDWENWWDLAERRERERGLSGLQGPKHYWRWQFCAAAGRDSPFKRSPKKSFGKSSYGLCHPSDDGSFLYSASPPFSNYLLFSCFVKIQQVAHMGSNSTIKTSFATRVLIVTLQIYSTILTFQVTRTRWDFANSVLFRFLAQMVKWLNWFAFKFNI